MPHIQAIRIVIGALVAILAGISSYLLIPLVSAPVDMYLSPSSGIRILEETFAIEVIVDAAIPTNVFSGRIEFDPTILRVESINYNTSVADLWAVLPWYSNGDGTITYAGGTTRQGGFVGSETLLTVTFKSIAPGSGELVLKDAHILKHDGLGTDITIEDPIGAIFNIEPEVLEVKTVFHRDKEVGAVAVLEEIISTDLNNDGKQNFADMSVFMVHMATQNLRSDFNQDGEVSIGDMSILMEST